MEPKLRIAILGTRGIPNRYGGFEAFAAELAPRLAQRGHRVTVYCPHDQPYQEPEYHGVRLVHRPNPEGILGTAGQFIYDLGCNLHSRREPFDVVLHLGYTSDSVWTRLWSPEAKHVTNMDGMEWTRAKYRPAVRAFLKKAEAWAARRSDLLIADHPVILKYLATKYATPAIYISYGAEIPEPSDEEATLPELTASGLRSGAYDLVLARMEPENKIETAIRAKLEAGGEIPLAIVSNDTGYGAILKKRYAAEPMIRFLPAVYRPGGADALRRQARFYIHGHASGGTNPSLLEAMACRCRILAHDNPFNRGVLESNGFFYADTASLATLLRTLDPDRNFTEAIAGNLERIRTSHDWEHITNQYEEALLSLVAGG